MKKNLLPINKKVKKKNQISKYHILSLRRLIKIIYQQSINEKPPNLIGYQGEKPKDFKYI